MFAAYFQGDGHIHLQTALNSKPQHEPCLIAKPIFSPICDSFRTFFSKKLIETVLAKTDAFTLSFSLKNNNNN